MVQILLKNKVGMITRVMTTVEELADALNDPLVKTQCSLSDLFSYLMRNHYHTTINGVSYYNSSYSVGINQPIVIVFTELDLPGQNKPVKVVLKDQADAVLLERDMDYNEVANLLEDPQIKQCTNETELELYIVSNHYTTKINGEIYRHKEFSMGINHKPTFVFVKL